MKTQFTRKRSIAQSAFAAAIAGIAAMMPASMPLAGGATPSDHRLAGSCNSVVTPIGQEGPTTILHLDLSCHFAGIGAVTGVATQRVTPAGPPAGTNLPVQISTDVTYVAGPSGQFATLFTGGGNLDLVSLEVTFAGSETVVGGNGRFLQITGWSVAIGVASTKTNIGAFAIGGEIRY